jgi:hypothetical protein
MFAEWIVGLLVALVATPVAIASYVSAHRASAAECQPPRFIRARYRAPVPAPADAAHHRHYHRHLAA